MNGTDIHSNNSNLRERFHPNHYDDLTKSGLSDETIEKAGLATVPPRGIHTELGFNHDGIESVLKFPYPGNNGFARYRIIYNPDAKGKKPKYIQQKGTSNHLYIPDSIRPNLSNVEIPLYITEGEKKTLKGCQEGLCCIGLSGLWNWTNGKRELIQDFNVINFTGREVNVVPDNDWLTPNKHGYDKNLREAVYSLAFRLRAQGAKVSIVSLPQGETKIGLDDYLIQNSIESFHSLPVTEVKTLEERIAEIKEVSEVELEDVFQDIARLPSESAREVFIGQLKKTTGIRKESLRNDIGKYVMDSRALLGNDNEEIPRPVFSANFPDLVDVAIDDADCVVYLMKSHDTISVQKDWVTDEGTHLPPSREHLPFTLPRATEVLKWCEKNDLTLFEDIIRYLKRFSYVDEPYWLILACNVFLSYILDHSDVHYLPMILFFASPERGKSRTGKAMVYIVYRGVHVVDLREPNLFRFSENLRATIFFDLMSLWKKAERTGTEDILLLRYEKGAKCSRVLYPDRGAFEDTRHYEVYGSTIIATNEAIHHILDTRAINIPMPNKPGRYENPTPGAGLELKERLTAWRAKMMDKPLPEVDHIPGIEGRFWDISKPLLQVCIMVYPNGLDSLVKVLREVAGQRRKDKADTIEGQIVSILQELSPDGLSAWEIKTGTALERLNEGRPDAHKITSQYLGKKLRAMGLRTRISNGHSLIMLSQTDFPTFIEQYTAIESDQADSLNSPYSTEPSPETVNGSVRVGESGINSPETHHPEKADNVNSVESGECSEFFPKVEASAICSDRPIHRNCKKDVGFKWKIHSSGGLKIWCIKKDEWCPNVEI